MKKTKILYWIFTGLFAAFMTFSAIPDIISTPEAIQLVHDQLGYPLYLLPFLGIAKILGAIVIVIPGFNRLKEWAYAGLFIDLIGATYSLISIGSTIAQWGFMVLPFMVAALSYVYHQKKLDTIN
jgi:uncharacterized membrane protein YphA (DoxX/SURF4 family)